MFSDYRNWIRSNRWRANLLVSNFSFKYISDLHFEPRALKQKLSNEIAAFHKPSTLTLQQCLIITNNIVKLNSTR